MRPDLSTRKTAMQKAFSLLFLAVFLFLQTLAAAPVLHQHLHHDAGKADHHCVVTMLAHGRIHTPPTPVVAAAPTDFVLAPELAPEFLLVAVDYRLLPGRGPPSLLS
jgi:hypothetical protein